eukprot:4197774-Ditylum_brightwellii.AAC.1
MNVGMKGIHNPNDPGCSDNIGRLAIKSHLYRDEDIHTKSLVVVMDEVVRQQDKEFLNVLDSPRNGRMEDRHINFMLIRLLHDMPLKDQQSFDNDLNTMSTWKEAIPMTGTYLRSLNIIIAKIVAQYSSKQGIGKIHCVEECCYPALSRLGVGLVVMLLKNYIPELCWLSAPPICPHKQH